MRVASGGSVRAGPSAKAGRGAGRAKLGQVRDAGLGRAGEEGSGPRVGFCLGPVWLWVCFSFSFLNSNQRQLIEFKLI